MKGKQNLKQSQQNVLCIAKTINRVMLQACKGSKFIVTMLAFELSILLSILRSFYRGDQLPTFFNAAVVSISSAILIQSDSRWTNVEYANIVRLTIITLHCSALTLTLILGFLKNSQLQQKTIENMLAKVLTVLLIFTVPIVLFSAEQVTKIQNNYSTAFIDIFNIAFSIFLVFFMQKISGEVEYGRNRSTKTAFGQNRAGIKGGRVIISCLFIVLDGQSSSWFMIVALSMLALTLVELKMLLSFPKYLTPIYQMITEIRVILTLSLTTLAVSITATDVAILQKNIEILFIFLSLFLYKSLKRYQQSKRAAMLIYGIDVIESEMSAISYILELIRIQQSHQQENYEEELIISVILQNHSNHCLRIICACHSTLNQVTRRKFLKELVMEHIKTLSNKFPLSFGLKLICIGFQLTNGDKLISVSLEVHRLLRLAQLRKLSLENSFLLNELKIRIQQKFDDHTEASKSIQCENIFKEDVIKVDVLHNLDQLISLNIRKYKLISLDCSNLNKIEEYTVSINRFSLKIEENWAYLRSINSFSFEIHQIFIFYFQSVVPSPIQAKKYIGEIATKLQKVRLLRGVCRESINKYLYSKKTCIIESDIRQSFGVIQNITVNCSEVLGISKDRLMGRYIDDIMPEYFAKNHQLVVANWLQKGTAVSKMVDMVDFGYVDSKLNCFQGYLFLKIHSDGERLLFYSTIIRQNDNDYLLLNGRLAIEGIGKRLLKEEIFVKDHVKHSIFEYTELSMEKAGLGSTLRTSILLQNLYNSPELQHVYEQSSRHSNYDPSMLKFQCSIAVTRYKIWKQEYFLIKFQNIRKWLSSIKSMRDSKPSPQSMKESSHSRAIITMPQLDDDILLQEQYDSVDSAITNHIKYSQIFKAQTIKSSVHEHSSSQITFYSNFTFNAKKCFVNPSFIPMNFYKKMTLFLFVVCSILIAQFFSLRNVFNIGFGSFNDVMFGDGAVSDNNQILQIMYNGILMSKVYCKVQVNSDRCRYLLNSTKQISNILYRLYTDDVEVYLKNRTTLTNLKYYASYDIQVPFTVGATVQNISTLQFMQYYYYAINQQYNLIKSGNFSVLWDEAMKILIDNWPQMKYINHNAISFYLEAGSKELDLLMQYLLILIAGLCLFLLLLAGGLYYNDSVQCLQKFRIFSIYGYMNATMIKDIIDYYISLKQSIGSEKFRPCQLVNNSSDREINRNSMRYDKNACCLLQIIIVWGVLMIVAGLEILQVQLILQPSRNMVMSINNLMDSENYLLEAYFQLKTYYLQFNYNKSIDQMSSQLSAILSQAESDFTKTAKKSIDLFSSDPSFIEDFNNLLVSNVCSLTQVFFSPAEVTYCRNNFTYSTLSLGLVNSMTFFQRNAYEALKELQRRQSEEVNKTEYFTRKVFQDIDDSIFYMFRLYQATQARMYEGLNFSVSESLIFLDILNSCSVAVFVLLLGWWLFGLKSQRRTLMQLYGAVLQFPETVMKKMVVEDVVEQLEMQF